MAVGVACCVGQVLDGHALCLALRGPLHQVSRAPDWITSAASSALIGLGAALLE